MYVVILSIFTKVGFYHMIVCGSFLRHVEICISPDVRCRTLRDFRGARATRIV